METTYTRANFPHFVTHHGNWDIYCNASGYCVSIPTEAAAGIGCRASHFGSAGYMLATLGASCMDGASDEAKAAIAGAVKR